MTNTEESGRAARWCARRFIVRDTPSTWVHTEAKMTTRRSPGYPPGAPPLPTGPASCTMGTGAGRSVVVAVGWSIDRGTSRSPDRTPPSSRRFDDSEPPVHLPPSSSLWHTMSGHTAGDTTPPLLASERRSPATASRCAIKSHAAYPRALRSNAETAPRLHW